MQAVRAIALDRPDLYQGLCYVIDRYRETAMTALVEKLLNTFDRLTDSERLYLVLEILKRTADLNFPPLSDEDLVRNAEGLFLELDEQEALYE